MGNPLKITDNTTAVIDEDYVTIKQQRVIDLGTEVVNLTHEDMSLLIEQYQDRMTIKE